MPNGFLSSCCICHGEVRLLLPLLFFPMGQAMLFGISTTSSFTAQQAAPIFAAGTTLMALVVEGHAGSLDELLWGEGMAKLLHVRAMLQFHGATTIFFTMI